MPKKTSHVADPYCAFHVQNSRYVQRDLVNPNVFYTFQTFLNVIQGQINYLVFWEYTATEFSLCWVSYMYKSHHYLQQDTMHAHMCIVRTPAQDETRYLRKPHLYKNIAIHPLCSHIFFCVNAPLCKHIECVSGIVTTPATKRRDPNQN